MNQHIQLLHPEDNVAIAVDDFEAGQSMPGIEVQNGFRQAISWRSG